MCFFDLTRTSFRFTPSTIDKFNASNLSGRSTEEHSACLQHFGSRRLLCVALVQFVLFMQKHIIPQE